MRTTESGFNEEVYLAAAGEHITSANELYQAGRFVLAYYVSGLAVECLFRAYAALVGAEHDERHDLRRLAESGRFFDFVPTSEHERIAAALGDVLTRWRNNHRYRSESALRKYLNDQSLYKLKGSRTIQGDVIAYNGALIVNGATEIVTLGVARWEISKKKWRRS